MKKLQFIVDYNAILFNFVDSLSKWDYFVGSHILRYFEKKYLITSKTKEQLQKYAEIRKEMGWDKESDLFDWAKEGFRESEEFTPLLETIKALEAMEDHQGDTLESELQQATQYIQNLLPSVYERFTELGIDDEVEKLALLFETPTSRREPLAYLTYSPVKSYQGGANGHNIYSQVPLAFEEDEQVQQAVEFLSHEYLHKAINPGRYFLQKDEDFYNQKFTHLYPDRYFSFTEESIIYTVNDVMTFGAKVDEMVEHYTERHHSDEQKRNHFTSLWRSCEFVEPIIRAYLGGETDKETTLAALDKFYRGLTKT